MKRARSWKVRRAIGLLKQADHLADQGRAEDALAPSEEAVAIYRGLAAADPGAFRRGLAISLERLSLRLAGLGRREEALALIEEAVTIYREPRPGRQSRYPGLAPLLYRQSDLLAELGREQEALAAIEEAVHIYRELAAASPAPFSADLADSLDNSADLLSTLERHSDAAAARAQATQLRGHL